MLYKKPVKSLWNGGTILIHQKFDVNRSPSLLSIVLDALGPGGALHVDQDSRGRVLQLDHHDGLEVTQLIPVREEVGWESSPKINLSNFSIKVVFILFTAMVKGK